MKRVYNFSAGPCCLPTPVLHDSQEELMSWRSSGQSVLEMSHRGKEFSIIYNQTVNDLKLLMDVPMSHDVLFMQGGATLQFSAVPLNLFSNIGSSSADYLITGSWSKKAAEECEKYGKVNIACDAFQQQKLLTRIPDVETWSLSKEARYVHYCSNETVMGVEFPYIPDVMSPLVCDASSDFCSFPVDVSKFAVIYAGAQKNLGPAGCAVVVVDKTFIANLTPPSVCPTIMNYKITMKNESMYNTPPCFGIYMIGLMAKYLKDAGGLRAAEERRNMRSQTLYDFIDSSDGYYEAPVETSCRSRMNVPFRVGFRNVELESKFTAESEKRGLVNLGGHRSVGGCRASLYNGMPIEGVLALIEFMEEFKDKHPMEESTTSESA